MRYRKTYGIHGLLEWHGTIENNGVKMRVDFTNGSVSAYGVSPATFTTDNELTQLFIESSEQFKGGRIHLRSAAPIADVPRSKQVSHATPTSSATSTENPVGMPEKKEVEVNSLAEAKDYLVENHGIAASKLRSRAQILEQAASCGVAFNGI